MFGSKSRSGPRGSGSVPKKFVAIDFDSRGLHIVCARRTRGGAKIQRLLHAEIPESVDTSDAKAFGAFLGQTLKKMRLGVKAVVMSVPRGLAVLKPLQFPPGTEFNQLAGMVQFQVEKELPFPLAEAVVDFTIASHYDAENDDNHPHVHVLVSAVRLAVVEHYKQVALSAGVKLIRLGLRPSATMRCVSECLGETADGPLALIHVTADETEIMVLDGGALAFSRSALFPEPLSSSPDEAESSPQSRSMAGEIARSLQTYQAAEGGGSIERVLLAGGTGIEAQITESLGRRLGVTCERFDPAEALGLSDADGQAPAFIAALGMAVGNDGSATPFDFIHPKRPRVKRNIKKIRRGLAATAAAILVAGGVATGIVWVHGKQAEVARLKSKVAKLKKARKPVDLQAKQLRYIREWEAQDIDLLGHWAYVSGSAPSCKDIYITSLKTGADSDRKPCLNIAFRAKSPMTEIRFGKMLRGSDPSYDVKTNRVATSDDPFDYGHGGTLIISPPEDVTADLSSVNPEPRPEDDASRELMHKKRKETRR